MKNNLKILPITQILHLNGEEVVFDKMVKLYGICLDMQILCKKEGGVGLSAVQVGLPLKLFVAYLADSFKYRYFANCSYVPHGLEIIPSIEGCLSIKDKIFKVKRFASVKVTGFEIVEKNGKPIPEPFEMVFHSSNAILMQHEIDHQNRISINQIGEQMEIWK